MASSHDTSESFSCRTYDLTIPGSPPLSWSCRATTSRSLSRFSGLTRVRATVPYIPAPLRIDDGERQPYSAGRAGGKFAALRQVQLQELPVVERRGPERAVREDAVVRLGADAPLLSHRWPGRIDPDD